ncbi:50S ribosomal protein L13 [Microvenator marinus]|uniref:Large ribosomal subunit protein uL13 n=1 Tax=Microvenator marinus TaxID=2600177 RepID=A0A5B8Y1U7_9DELT|nr:50S ribosomal protein L13 [Microvenator marinus]
MKTISANPSNIERAWHVVDLEGQTLGRAAARIASVLRGKHKPTFTPHEDTGDFVICINADKVVLTGRKLDKKIYRRHSQYPGGLKEIVAKDLLEKSPEQMIEFAVQGMLPKGPLGRRMLKKLNVYAGAEHPHAAQQPQPLAL